MTKSAEPSTPSGSSETQQRRRKITSYKNTTTSPATDSRSAKKNPPAQAGGFGVRAQSIVLDLHAKAGHRGRRVDAGSRSSKAELGARRAREARGQTVCHPGVGDAGIDIEMLVDDVVRQERYLIVVTRAVRLAGAASRARRAISDIGILADVVIGADKIQTPSHLVLGTHPVELKDFVGREGVVVRQRPGDGEYISASRGSGENGSVRVCLIDMGVTGEERQLVARSFGCFCSLGVHRAHRMSAEIEGVLGHNGIGRVVRYVGG